MVTRTSQGITKFQLHHVFDMAFVLAAGIFFFHTHVLFEVVRCPIVANSWLTCG
jgi:hypothetical protein